VDPTDDTVLADDEGDSPSADDDDLRRLLADVAAAPAQVPPAVAGDRVGRYVLIRKLGAGGMGVVFAAYDPQLDRRVAIKLLRVDLVASSGSVRARERTLREARALARLIHPGIVAVHDAGFHKGELYIVMELVEGESLRDWLAAGPRPVAAIVDVFRQAAIGLSAAHAQQMVHRDFKPDNVLIGRDGRVRVADFGLVHIADGGAERSPAAADDAPDARATVVGSAPGATAAAATTATTAAAASRSGAVTVGLGRAAAAAALSPALAATPALTVTGAFMGTPGYMAPEQLDGAEVDARADQFAFGITLWAALYGAPPWTVAELGPRRAAMAAGPPPDPETARAVPTWLRAVVRRTLAPAPADRFPTMTAVVAAIDRGLARRRRITTAVAGVTITGVVAAALAVGALRERGPEPCGGGRALIGQVWNPGRAAEVRARLAGRGLDLRAMQPLLGRLDGYARDWAADHRAACRATRVDRAQTEQVLDQRMACLDRARASLRAVVGALADGRLDDPGRRGLADDLPAIAACSDRETLDGVEARPAAVDQARLEAAIAQMLDAKLAVYDVARADATDRSEEALRQARATGWAPLVADAALIHGELLRQRQRYDQARPFYDEALREALRGSPPRVQAEIMASLAYLELLRDDHALAQAWIDRAMALSSRLHRPAELELLILDDAFAIALATGDPTRAKAFAEREVALASAAAPPDDHRLADALLDLGRLASDEGRYADAVATIDRALAVGRGALGDDTPWQAVGLQAEIEPLIALGRTRDARTAVERAIAVRRPVFGPDDAFAAELYTLLGAIAQRHGDLAGARAAYEGSVPRAIATHGADATATAMAIANLAMIDAEAGDFARAETGALQAQGIFERKLGAGAPELINVLVLRAYAARGQRRFADARGHLERAHAIAARALGADHPDTANIEVELGHTDRLEGRRPAAIARYQAIVGRADLPPPMIAEAGFGLAQAAWDQGTHGPARAAAENASNTYLLLGDDFAGKRAEVEAWLAAHPPE